MEEDRRKYNYLAYNLNDLDDREYLFVKVYAATFDVVEAAFVAKLHPSVKALPQKKDREYQRLRTSGNALLKRPDIRAAIDRELTKIGSAYEISAERVLRELAALAFSNIGDFIDWDENGVALKRAQEIPDAKKAAIANIKETRSVQGTNVSLNLHAKEAALDKLGKYLRLFGETGIVDAEESAARIRELLTQMDQADGLA